MFYGFSLSLCMFLYLCLSMIVLLPAEYGKFEGWRRSISGVFSFHICLLVISYKFVHCLYFWPFVCMIVLYCKWMKVIGMRLFWFEWGFWFPWAAFWVFSSTSSYSRFHYTCVTFGYPIKSIFCIVAYKVWNWMV